MEKYAVLKNILLQLLLLHNIDNIKMKNTFQKNVFFIHNLTNILNKKIFYINPIKFGPYKNFTRQIFHKHYQNSDIFAAENIGIYLTEYEIRADIDIFPRPSIESKFSPRPST